MTRVITWNLLGLSRIKTGIEDLAISYSNLAYMRYPEIGQEAYISEGSDWISKLSPNCEIIEIPRSHFDIARPFKIGKKSHSWAKCISKWDSQYSSSYTVHDWGPFFDNSMPSHHRLMWASSIYQSICRAETIHFLNKAFVENAPWKIRKILSKKNLVISAPPSPHVLTSSETDIGSRYILSIGSNLPRKNLSFLAKIWSNQDLERRAGLKLVLIGNGTEHLSQEGVLGLGYVSDQVLSNFLTGCVGLISPSRYEGQNLPIRDALALGKPVIATRKSSLAYSENAVMKIESLRNFDYLKLINWLETKNGHLNSVVPIVSDTENELLDFLVNH